MSQFFIAANRAFGNVRSQLAECSGSSGPRLAMNGLFCLAGGLIAGLFAHDHKSEGEAMWRQLRAELSEYLRSKGVVNPERQFDSRVAIFIGAWLTRQQPKSPPLFLAQRFAALTRTDRDDVRPHEITHAPEYFELLDALHGLTPEGRTNLEASRQPSAVYIPDELLQTGVELDACLLRMLEDFMATVH